MNKKYKVKVLKHITMADCQKLVVLQKRIWKMEDIDILPPWMLFVVPKMGNILIVGYKSKTPVSLALLTLSFDEKAKKKFFYGDMMGVDPKHERHGLGAAMLKIARREAIRRGYNSIRWTFDPLRSDNAHLYLGKMGATVRKYYEDYYSNLSGINAGVPIDRFWAEVSINAKSGLNYIPEVVISMDKYSIWKKAIKDKPILVGVEIPDSIVKIKKHSLKKAKQVRLQTREIFKGIFARKYVLRGFCRKDERNCYVAVRM